MYNGGRPKPVDDLRPPYLTGMSRELGSAAWDPSYPVDELPPPSVKSFKLDKEYTLLTKCVAELVGTMVFVFIGTMQGFLPDGSDGVLHAALAHGLTIFILASSLGHISGGHFNPAVSWSVFLSKRLPVHYVPCYWASQLLGGCLGALLTVSILGSKQFAAVKAGATLLGEHSAWYEGLIAEAACTFILCHSVLNTAVDTDKFVLAPLAIGISLGVSILATGTISGCSLNPARSFGPNLIGQFFIDDKQRGFGWWEYHYIYWVGPLIGGSIAAGLYWLFESRDRRVVR